MPTQPPGCRGRERQLLTAHQAALLLRPEPSSELKCVPCRTLVTFKRSMMTLSLSLTPAMILNKRRTPLGAPMTKENQNNIASAGVKKHHPHVMP